MTRLQKLKQAEWWLDLIERTLKTAAQGFLSVVTLDSLSTHVTLEFREKILSGVIAAGYAVLTAFASSPFQPTQSTSSVLHTSPVEP